VLLVGLAVSLGLMQRAVSAEEQARENEAKAVANAELAQANEAKAVAERDAKDLALQAEQKALREKAADLAAEQKARAAERLALDLAKTALRSMTDEIVENQMARGTTLTEENKHFLRTILTQFEALAAVTGDDADSRAIRAEGLARVGLMRHRLGELQEAEAAWRDDLALFKQLVTEFPTRPEFRQELAMSHLNLGVLLLDTGRLQEAEAAWRDDLALFKQLVTEFPNQPDLRNELAGTLVNLAIVHRQQKQWSEAQRRLDEGRPHHLAALKANPRNPTYRQLYRNHLSVRTTVQAGLLEPERRFAPPRPAATQVGTRRPTPTMRPVPWPGASRSSRSTGSSTPTSGKPPCSSMATRR
jgi:tetratricopeptide (TPR) repeat protein